jgi:predicted 2-oxoglutarate/Fe(II)-dependent dioxygenase YbiX
MHSIIDPRPRSAAARAVGPAFCASVRAAMDRGAADPAEILEDAIEHQDHVRKTLSIDVNPANVALVEEAIEARRADLAARFSLNLGPREGAGFLRYLPGGFYRPHRDRGDLPSWPGAARRQLAVVCSSTPPGGGDPEGSTAACCDCIRSVQVRPRSTSCPGRGRSWRFRLPSCTR